MNISIIAAIDEKLGIGKNGQIPWYMPEDLMNFAHYTIGQGNNAVIMGKRTWFSLPRPLSERYNVVLTHHTLENVACFRSIPSALAHLHARGVDEVFLIGGHTVFMEGLDLAQRLYFSRIPGNYHCDTFFPPLDSSCFVRILRHWVSSKASPLRGFFFEQYLRVTSSPPKLCYLPKA